MSSWLYYLFGYLKRMGCVLMKSSLTVEGQKYVIKKQVAEGGFSTVELAENTTTKRLGAIKRITCHSIQDQNLAKHEIEVHRKLKHDNIIRLIGEKCYFNYGCTTLCSIEHSYILFGQHRNTEAF